jgi:hypothetical protein
VLYTVGCAPISGIKMDEKHVRLQLGLLGGENVRAMAALPAGLWSGPWALGRNELRWAAAKVCPFSIRIER